MLEQTLRTLGLEPVGAALGSLGGHLASALEPLDLPRASLYNLASGLAEGDVGKALPGLLGVGVGAASVPFGGLTLPLAALLGSATGGLAQGMFGKEAMTPSDLIDLLGQHAQGVNPRYSPPGGAQQDQSMIPAGLGRGSHMIPGEPQPSAPPAPGPRPSETTGGMLASLGLGLLTDPLSFTGGAFGRAASGSLGRGIGLADEAASRVAPLAYQGEALSAIRPAVADSASRFEQLSRDVNAGNDQLLGGWRDAQAGAEAAHAAERQQALAEYLQQNSHAIGGESFFGPDVLAALQGEAPDVLTKLTSNPGVRVESGDSELLRKLVELAYAHPLPGGGHAVFTEGMPARAGQGFLRGRLTNPRGGIPPGTPPGPLAKLRDSVPEPFAYPDAPRVPQPALAPPPQADTISDVLSQLEANAGTGYARGIERQLSGRPGVPGGPFDRADLPGGADLAPALSLPTPEALAQIDSRSADVTARQKEIIDALGQRGGVPNWFYNKFLQPKM